MDFAIQSNCSNALTGNIEAGRDTLLFLTIVKFAEALKIQPADLFLLETSKPKDQIRQELKDIIDKLIDDIVTNYLPTFQPVFFRIFEKSRH